jgi:formate dehydrogenase major subunit
MVRGADGALHPASWEEALDRAAAGFLSVVKTYGPEAVGCFACSKATNEVNYLTQKVMRAALGTNNIDSCNRT